jgi:hypothetical protein
MLQSILCDIDNTIADFSGRDPYDMSSVFYDIPKEPVFSLIKSLQKDFLINFLTGRKESGRENTEMWLHKHGITNYRLYMRPENDNTPAPQFKKGMYYRYLYMDRPICVFDDDPEVLEIFKVMGLHCFQA